MYNFLGLELAEGRLVIYSMKHSKNAPALKLGIIDHFTPKGVAVRHVTFHGGKHGQPVKASANCCANVPCSDVWPIYFDQLNIETLCRANPYIDGDVEIAQEWLNQLMDML